jgi:patatin-like phospholipase/acyl hydrolase
MVHRILSLDGGGAWAILQAMALKEIYGDLPGHQILAKFDLAVANSGGSIVLAGLIENMTPGQIYDLFAVQANRASIFVPKPFFENLLSHIPIFPKYSTAGKLQGLSALFGAMGQQPLSTFQGPTWPKSPNGADVKILIVALDYDAMRACFFRSYSTPHGATADPVPLVEAVHASSDAPVEFFDAPTACSGRRYWDGAMAGLNNPLMAGVIDLMSDGVSATDLVVLSIGTGTVKLAPSTTMPPAPLALREPVVTPSALGDLSKAAGCITDDPPDMATFSTHVVLASAEGADPTEVGRVVRLSPVVRPILTGAGWVVPPGLTGPQFQALTNLSMDAVEQGQVVLLEALGESWLADGVRNQPIRMNSDDLSSSLGEELFSAAKARWVALSALAPAV